jgi:RimJ/RimL family protein N-acetyltransferase
VAVELKETGELVGDCAFCVQREEPTAAEIGFTFARPFQKRGYAFEAVSGLLPYFFSTLGLHRLIARTDSENHPAHALLERLGFRREGTERVWFKGAWGGEDRYVLDRPPVLTAN